MFIALPSALAQLSTMFTLRRGLSTLTDSIERVLRAYPPRCLEIRTNTKVSAFDFGNCHHTNGKLRLLLEGGGHIDADVVVSCAPAHAMLGVMNRSLPMVSSLLLPWHRAASAMRVIERSEEALSRSLTESQRETVLSEYVAALEAVTPRAQPTWVGRAMRAIGAKILRRPAMLAHPRSDWMVLKYALSCLTCTDAAVVHLAFKTPVFPLKTAGVSIPTRFSDRDTHGAYLVSLPRAAFAAQDTGTDPVDVVTVSLGASRDPEVLKATDAELVQRAVAATEHVLRGQLTEEQVRPLTHELVVSGGRHITCCSVPPRGALAQLPKPVYTSVHRWPLGLPDYNVGHVSYVDGVTTNARRWVLGSSACALK